MIFFCFLDPSRFSLLCYLLSSCKFIAIHFLYQKLEVAFTNKYLLNAGQYSKCGIQPIRSIEERGVLGGDS